MLLAIVFAWAASWAVTLACSATMTSMPGMSMPWLPMPGQTWFEVITSYLCMWLAMTVAMMLPSIAPALSRYQNIGVRMRSTAAATAGYLTVWMAAGLAIFPLGVAISNLLRQQPGLSGVVPFATTTVLLLSGALQFAPAKRRALHCCRHVAADRAEPGRCVGAAWRFGLRLGYACVKCCAGPMAVLLALGMMNVRVMLLVTLAITLERLLPHGERASQVTGLIAIGAGCFVLAG